MRHPSNDVLRLGDARVTAADCGNKAYWLSRLLSDGLHVPRGFVVTWSALRSGLLGEVPESDLDPETNDADFDAMRTAVEGAAFRDSALPMAVELELTELGLAPAAWVAVRSSSSAEDSKEAAFAGIFTTIRVQTTAQEVLAAVRRVFASRYSEAAVAYAKAIRGRRGIAVPLVQPMAVLVQEYVQSLFGGVVFTKNPMRPEQGLVEIARGGAEGVVDGTQRTLRMVFPLGNVWDVGTSKQVAELISEEKWRGFSSGLNEAVQRVVALCGPDQDIEWVWDGAAVWVLQARPLTSV